MSEEKTPFTKEQLKNFSKDLLIEMVLSMSSQMTEMNRQMALLTERINVMLGAQYGRRTEKSSEIPHQMEFCFNDAYPNCTCGRKRSKYRLFHKPFSA